MGSEGPHPGLHKMQGQNDAEIYSGSLDKPLGSPFLRMSVVTSSSSGTQGQLSTPSLSRKSDTEMGSQNSLE